MSCFVYIRLPHHYMQNQVELNLIGNLTPDGINYSFCEICSAATEIITNLPLLTSDRHNKHDKNKTVCPSREGPAFWNAQHPGPTSFNTALS